MWRLSMSDGSELASAGLDEAARAAAIAKMAQRLAAASQRKRPPTRGRVHSPAPGPLAAEGITNIWLENAAAADEAALDPSPAFAPRLSGGFAWREHIGTAQRVGVVGAMGACGFALVVLAQTPHLAKVLHDAMHPVAVAEQSTSAAPAAQPAPAPPQPVANSHWIPVGPATTKPIRVVRAPDHKAIAVAAAPRPAVHAQPMPQSQRTIQTTAQAAPSTVHARRPIAHAAAVALARTETTPARRRETSAAYELPRWVTQPETPAQHPAAHPVIMSPPPHDLTLLAASAPAPAASAAPGSIASAQPAHAAKPPSMMVASSAYPPAAPYARPEFRPFEPPRFGWYGGTDYPYYAPPAGGNWSQ